MLKLKDFSQNLKLEIFLGEKFHRYQIFYYFELKRVFHIFSV
jgi:hypothetical protein